MTRHSIESLIERHRQDQRIKVLLFWGHTELPGVVSKSCLSQWYDAPFVLDGERFLTAEHGMMYGKARLFDDQSAADRVLAAQTPGEAKAIGREVQGFDNASWLANRIEIVVRVNRAKFEQHPDLKRFLIGTAGRVLVEASPVDRIWGIGLAADDPACHDPNQWQGENLLGFALMDVRDQLISEITA